MSRFANNAMAVLMIAGMAAWLPACQKEGPAEKVGKSLDNAVKKTGDSIERAGEKVQDAAKQ